MLPVIKRRLHRQIYFTVVAALISVVVASAVFFFIVDRHERDNPFEVIAQLIAVAVPPAESSRAEMQERLDRMTGETNVELALFDREENLLASSGDLPATPNFRRLEFDEGETWQYDRRSQSWIMRLNDGRYFVASYEGFRQRPPLFGLLMYIVLIAAVIGLAAWPFVRKLTGRVERLQRGVEQIGAGELSTRVDVEGSDEIAALANSFNYSAAHIEKLVHSNRQLLANASHELRTPLARVRLGVEMLKEKPDPKRQFALERDIAELDALIDEILMMSRLDLDARPPLNETVDLLALAAEECARYPDCTLEGDPAELTGNTKLLRRLIRNLIDNAFKHGDPPVTVSIRAAQDEAILTVADAGPGIPADQREKVFQPFYRSADRQNVAGYGLGLALVAQIARAHGAHVAVADRQTSEISAVFPLTAPGK